MLFYVGLVSKIDGYFLIHPQTSTHAFVDYQKDIFKGLKCCYKI